MPNVLLATGLLSRAKAPTARGVPCGALQPKHRGRSLQVIVCVCVCVCVQY